jgi:FkbH-like protein
VERGGVTEARLAAALAAPSRRAVRHALTPRSQPLTLSEIQQLTRHLRSLAEPLEPLKAALLRTFTVEPLRPYWEFEGLLNGFDLDVHEAPYGSTIVEAAAGSGVARFDPDCTYVLLQWDDLDPAFAGVDTHAAWATAVDAAVDRAAPWLADLRAVVGGPIVLAVLPPMSPDRLGLYEPMAAEADADARRRVLRELASAFRARIPDTYLCDLGPALEVCGWNAFFDARLWFSGRFPFGVHGAQEVVRRLAAYPLVARRGTAKCIVLDGDNTLWGGVLGEDGVDGVALGPDFPGSVYVAFQRRLAAFRQRGILLALCTRNDPDDVARLLGDHPHQVLRAQHFAAISAGWGAKPEGLATIAAELDIGLDSVLYVDDSPQECHAVELALPAVETFVVPPRLVDLPRCLDDVARLEVLSLTEEDVRRSELYAQERDRRDSVRTAGGSAEHLAKLEMRMTIAVDDPAAVPRVAQLTQRTNQFNLTTRRYTEGEIAELVGDDDVLVAHCSLRDIFGDSGIVGVAIVRGLKTGEAVEVDTFLLSCRVIGRFAEAAFLGGVLDLLRGRGTTTVRARYLPTAKNQLVADFWPRHGFSAAGDGAYEGTVTAPIPIEAPIAVEFADAAPHEPV